jgi:hypothetical protein
LGKTRSQLRYGKWPNVPATAAAPAALSPAARQQADDAIRALASEGIGSSLDDQGRLRFRAGRIPSGQARRMMELRGDQIAARLLELRDAAIQS